VGVVMKREYWIVIGIATGLFILMTAINDGQDL
jgi:hypothetical protein